MKEMIEQIKAWAEERGINYLNPDYQALKITEEVGELIKALTVNESDEIREEIGDVAISLINLCSQLGIDFEKCIAFSLDKINNRKGEVVNGQYIKEEDLEKYFERTKMGEYIWKTSNS